MPSWSKNAAGGGPREPINARSETIAEKPTFRKLVSGRRCIVPADGYFEWQKISSKVKQPFFFRFPDTVKSEGTIIKDESKEDIKLEDIKDEVKQEYDPESRHPLTMAGLYDVWQDRETGEKIYTYCIITVPSAKKTAFVHDRMPAIIGSFLTCPSFDLNSLSNCLFPIYIDPSLVDMWLSPNIPFEEVAPLLQPYEDIDYYPVSNVVGNVRNDSIECVLPVSIKSEHSSPIKATSSSASPTKAITNFFRSVKDENLVKKEDPIKPERDAWADDVEVVEETTTESRRHKRKQRAEGFKIKAEKPASVITLDDDDEEDEEYQKLVSYRPKRLKLEEPQNVIVLGD